MKTRLSMFLTWLGNKFHNHKWVVLERIDLVNTHPFTLEKSLAGTRFILQCEVCGAIEKKDCR